MAVWVSKWWNIIICTCSVLQDSLSPCAAWTEAFVRVIENIASDRGFPTELNQLNVVRLRKWDFLSGNSGDLVCLHSCLWNKPVAVLCIRPHSILSVLLNMWFVNARKGCSRSFCFSGAEWQLNLFYCIKTCQPPSDKKNYPDRLAVFLQPTT